MARLTMPLLSPAFAGRSNNTVSTLALTRCAAICAPMTPAPRTATLRTFRVLDMWGYSVAAVDRIVRMRQVGHGLGRSEEHTSELQSLMRISYAVFCLKKKKISYSRSTCYSINCTYLHSLFIYICIS